MLISPKINIKKVTIFIFYLPLMKTNYVNPYFSSGFTAGEPKGRKKPDLSDLISIIHNSANRYRARLAQSETRALQKGP
tara:strand:+ start:1434 stop:1670 length:237 start_codon:yes stop_codon:yes gene_type:complete